MWLSLTWAGILLGSKWVGWPGIERTKTASGQLWCQGEDPGQLGITLVKISFQNVSMFCSRTVKIITRAIRAELVPFVHVYFGLQLGEQMEFKDCWECSGTPETWVLLRIGLRTCLKIWEKRDALFEP
eukprot:scaffold32566_cov19-Tisochrysis_lutea.AAC.1